MTQKNRVIQFNLIIFILYFGMSLVSYFKTLDTFFLSDDFDRIYRIQTQGIFGVWTISPDIFFRPLISITLFIDYSLWHLNPIGYHLSNTFFHALCSWSVYFLTSLLLSPSQLRNKLNQIISVISGFFFLTLHSHMEAVSWISARSDLVSTFFCLVALSLCLLYKYESKKFYLYSSYLLFLCGLLSKESVIIYPALVFVYEVYDYFQETQKSHKIYQTLSLPIFYCTAVLIYLGMRYVGIRKFLGGYGTGVHLNFDLPVLVRGLYTSLRVIIPPLPQLTEWHWQIFGSVFLLTFIVFCILGLRRGNLYQEITKLTLVLATFFGVTLLPFINIGVSTIDTQSERFLYFPSTFFSILLTLIMVSILIERRFLMIGLFSLIFFLSVQQIYRSSETWRTASEIAK